MRCNWYSLPRVRVSCAGLGRPISHSESRNFRGLQQGVSGLLCSAHATAHHQRLHRGHMHERQGRFRGIFLQRRVLSETHWGQCQICGLRRQDDGIKRPEVAGTRIWLCLPFSTGTNGKSLERLALARFSRWRSTRSSMSAASSMGPSSSSIPTSSGPCVPNGTTPFAGRRSRRVTFDASPLFSTVHTSQRRVI